MTSKYGKADLYFSLAIFACLVIFYPKVFLARSGLLVADHLWQHYPWAELLWNSARQFKPPFWTQLIHCGFPITAESQIGAFYPINLLFYFLFPLNWSYSYITIFHFLLCGFGIYLYAREMGFKPEGAFISAFLFLFGASHGGAYYNITSLKTIAWFPWALFLFERFYRDVRWRYLFSLSFVFAMTLIAGYMQIGTLCLFMFFIYILLRLLIFKDPGETKPFLRVKVISGLAISALMALTISAPQIWLTYQLALYSNRVGLVEEYAYVGSMFPGAISTVFFPHWYNVFRGNSFYMGIFAVLLAAAAFYVRDAGRKRFLKLWCCLGIMALLMALGQWSPLYVVFVKLTRFYSFRTPAKFIVFVCLNLAFLGGLGFQNLWEAARRRTSPRFTVYAGTQFLALCLFFVCSAGVVLFTLKFGKEHILKFGDWFIGSFLYGKAGHPHTFEMYRILFERTIDHMLGLFTLQPWVVWNCAMIFVGVGFSLWLMRAKKSLRVCLAAGFFFLFVDLYGFASMMFKKGFDEYQNVGVSSPVIMNLVKAHEEGLVNRVYGFNYQWKLLPVLPSLNMVYGYADIGAYSPFVLKRYYETIGLLGNVNDSNFAYWPTPEFVMEHLNLLKLTGVSHVLSLYPFVHRDLELLSEDEKNSLFLYRFKPVRSKAFFVSNLKVLDDWEAVKETLLDPGFDPFSTLLIEKPELTKLDRTISDSMHPLESNKSEANIASKRTTPELEQWHVTTTRAGYFVVANSYYPGWHASVNGKGVEILKAYGLFQAIPITDSSNLIEFRFSPFDRGISFIPKTKTT